MVQTCAVTVATLVRPEYETRLIVRRPDAEAIGAAFATGAHGAVYIGETDRRIGSADDDRYVRDDATYSCSAATIDGTVVGIFVVSVGT